MRRHIPNAITCCNLLAGCVAVFYAFIGSYGIAFAAIIIGACFDFLDGLTARALRVSSPIGKELDSLADVVTFGVAPSAMVFSTLADCFDVGSDLECYAPFVAFLIAAFSALRLAKFNLDERQAYGFYGLPTPANALFWGSLIAGGVLAGIDKMVVGVAIVVLVVISCVLLVCDLPLLALKVKRWAWRGNEVKLIFIVGCVPLLLTLGVSGFAPIVGWYVVLSIFAYHFDL